MFDLQQEDVREDMLNYSVEIECPTTRRDNIPAFLWATARRAPGGVSTLYLESGDYDYKESPQIQELYARLLEYLELYLKPSVEGEAAGDAAQAAEAAPVEAQALEETKKTPYGPRGETLTKIAMVRVVRKIWELRQEAACECVDILPRTYRRYDKPEWEADIKNEIAYLGEEFEEFIKHTPKPEKLLYERYKARTTP